MAFFNFGRKNNKPKTNSLSDKITKEISKEESLKDKIEQKLLKTEQSNIYEKEFENILPLIMDYTKITKDLGFIEKFFDIYIKKEISITHEFRSYSDDNMSLYSDIVKLISTYPISMKTLEILIQISNLKIVYTYVDMQEYFNKLFADKIIEALFELNESQYIEKIPNDILLNNYLLESMIDTSKEKNRFDILVAYLMKIELSKEHGFSLAIGTFVATETEKKARKLFSEAFELSIDELIKDLTSSDSTFELVNFGNKYPPIYENKKIFNFMLSDAKRTHNFEYIIKIYNRDFLEKYTAMVNSKHTLSLHITTLSEVIDDTNSINELKIVDDIVDAIISSCKETKDYSSLSKLSKTYPSIYYKDAVFNYLLSDAKRTHNFEYIVKIYNKVSIEKYAYTVMGVHTTRIAEFLTATNIKIVDTIISSFEETKDYSFLLKLAKTYSSLYYKGEVFNYVLSEAKRTHDFDLVFDKYHYKGEVFNYILSEAKKTQDFSFVMRYFNKINKDRNTISNENITKIIKYLLSVGKTSEVIKKLDYSKYILVPFFEYCVSNDNAQNLKYMINYVKQRRTYYNYLMTVDKEKLFRVLKDINNAESDIVNFLIILFLEADTILQDYKEVNFSQNPEVDISLKSLKSKNGDNYPKFHASIKKIIKSGKPTLALYILNKNGDYNSQSDAKLWVDSYVESFVMLDRVDILAKYYIDFVISSQNIELLQSIAQYYIKEKKPQKALTVVEDITKLEPTYPFIQTARHEIDRLTMIEELSQNDIDVDSMNTLTGEAFERLLMQKFEELGFKVIETPRTGDFGADIIVDTKDETRFVIQCKRFKSKVNLKAVQEVVGALPHYGGDIGIVITNSDFLSSAIKLAESNDIELWDNLKLMKFLTGDISFSQLSEL